jgi:ComF family protein
MRAGGATTLRDAACVVPVPLHPWRRFRRGFNQAADLAHALGVPVGNILRRRRRTTTQTDLPEAERHTNVLGAFAVRRWSQRRIEGRTIVLVDDVSTTGATLDACAAVLLQAGAKDVRALTAARAPSRLP